MKTIGLIGGMSWESTVEYYRLINEEIRVRCGGLHSAKCILYSVDFAEIEYYQRTDNWDQAAQVLIGAAQNIAKGGADFIIISTNTMHKVFDEIQKSIDAPILHIADATANEINAKGIKTVGLLGTRYTMEQDFYKSRLRQGGINVLILEEKDRNVINKVIYDELCLGKVLQRSKEEYMRIILELETKGAQGIILGCTEIGLLIKQAEVKIPLFDTTYIHAIKAVENALK
jgi:amino-acid racemase